MKTDVLILLVMLSPLPLFAADDLAMIKSRGVLAFEDDFNRDEATPDKEDIGKGWTSNSAGRAKGHKQVDLADGAMHVTKHAEANHGVAIFHDVAFQDGAVQLKFKLGLGDDLGVDFVDRELKTVHAGHLCNAKITLKGLSLTDTKTGGADLKIQELREKGALPPEVVKLLKTKTTSIPMTLQPEEWHTLLVVVEGDILRATVDGNFAGQLKSEGIAHPTKRMITLAVNKSAVVDDLSIWKLK